MDISNGDMSRNYVAGYNHDKSNSIINILNDKAGLGYDYRMDIGPERSLSASISAEIPNDYNHNILKDRNPRDSFEINQKRMTMNPNWNQNQNPNSNFNSTLVDDASINNFRISGAVRCNQPFNNMTHTDYKEYDDIKEDFHYASHLFGICLLFTDSQS